MTVTETDPSDIVQDKIDDYDEEMYQVAATALGFGAGIFVLTRGWRLLKKLFG